STGQKTRRHKGTKAQGFTSLQAPGGWPLGGECFVLRSAQIAADAVLVDEVHNEFVAQPIRSDQKRHGLIRRAVFLRDAAVVGIDDDVELLPFHISLLQLDQNVSDVSEFLALIDVKLEVLALASFSELHELTCVVS